MRRHGKNGFSMVEAILGVVIISSCFISLMNVMSDTTIANIKVDFLTTSVLLARGKMSEVMARDFDSITNVADQSFGGDFSSYNYSVTASYVNSSDLNTAVAGPTDYKKVTVAVSLAGRPDTVTIEDLRVKIQ